MLTRGGTSVPQSGRSFVSREVQHCVGSVAGGSVAREVMLCTDANGRTKAKSPVQEPDQEPVQESCALLPSLWKGHMTGDGSRKKGSVCVCVCVLE